MFITVHTLFSFVQLIAINQTFIYNFFFQLIAILINLIFIWCCAFEVGQFLQLLHLIFAISSIWFFLYCVSTRKVLILKVMWQNKQNETFCMFIIYFLSCYAFMFQNDLMLMKFYDDYADYWWCEWLFGKGWVTAVDVFVWKGQRAFPRHASTPHDKTEDNQTDEYLRISLNQVVD